MKDLGFIRTLSFIVVIILYAIALYFLRRVKFRKASKLNENIFKVVERMLSLFSTYIVIKNLIVIAKVSQLIYIVISIVIIFMTEIFSAKKVLQEIDSQNKDLANFLKAIQYIVILFLILLLGLDFLFKILN